MTSEIRDRQKKYSASKSDIDKKQLGQYFTDAPIAEYMSSLIDMNRLNRREVNILDSGAGYGILTISTAIHLLNNGTQIVNATLYELDAEIIVYLEEVLNETRTLFQNQNAIFNYRVIHDDFILNRPDLNDTNVYDLSIINPPYFKYSVKESIYAKKTKDLFKGDPNIYASFVAVTLSCLINGGQLIAITPRSFLNGLYFKGFRNYLLNNSRLEHIHIFNSRKDVFTDSDILQENIIFKLIKDETASESISISSSNSILDLTNPTLNEYPTNIIIDTNNLENIIRVPESRADFHVLQSAEQLPSTFQDEGYFISTGPVVEHRTKEYKSENIELTNQVPLIKAHNVNINGITWGNNNPKDLSFMLKDNYEKHLVKNKIYLILKRFTSKDERRRLVAGVYNPIEDIKLVGITNKLNYIGRKDSDLSDIEAKGLSVFFNSVFMDNYYRCISGNTQVNATDVRIMKFPKREQIIRLGTMATAFQELSYDNIEEINTNI